MRVYCDQRQCQSNEPLGLHGEGICQRTDYINLMQDGDNYRLICMSSANKEVEEDEATN